VLKRLFRHTPQLQQAYQLREQLTAIFEQPITKAQGQRKIRTWIRQVKKKWAELLRGIPSAKYGCGNQSFVLVESQPVFDDKIGGQLP
jgi:hypothetical protein